MTNRNCDGLSRLPAIRRWTLAALLFLAALAAVGSAAADTQGEGDESPWRIEAWRVQASLYTRHFDPDPDHNNDQNLWGVEAEFANRWLAGAAVFDNSFGQPSQLVYVGKIWPLLGSEHWYFKLTGGLLHGYKEPYEDKIPLNGLGIAPAIIPALGFRYRRVILEANLGGLAVVTFTGGIRF